MSCMAAGKKANANQSKTITFNIILTTYPFTKGVHNGITGKADPCLPELQA